MDQLIKDILSILLEPSVTFLVGIITVLITRNSTLSSIARERLELVYHPLFLEIEPFLYKEVSYQQILPFINKFHEIESNHSLLIDPSLRYWVHNLKESDKIYKTDKYSNNEWFYICDKVSKVYDSLCRHAHLPVRSIAYRVNNRQYKTKISFVFACMWLYMPAIIFFSLILGIINPNALIISYALLAFFLIRQI